MVSRTRDIERNLSSRQNSGPVQHLVSLFRREKAKRLVPTLASWQALHAFRMRSGFGTPVEHLFY